MGKNQHVTPANGMWQVKGAGNEKATKLFDTQKEAISYGRVIAKNQKSELVVHNAKGRIRDRDSYGNDPCPPKDKKCNISRGNSAIFMVKNHPLCKIYTLCGCYFLYKKH